MADVRSETNVEPVDVLPAPQRLLVDHRRFELDADVETDDTVHAVGSPWEVGAIAVRAGELGAGLADWFAPECGARTVQP